jgi:hypothetical protein
VTVKTFPPEVVRPVDVKEEGIVVITLPFESVVVIDTADSAVVSGALVTRPGTFVSETQVTRVDGGCWDCSGAGTITVDVDC